jgi:hypothetical protein
MVKHMRDEIHFTDDQQTCIWTVSQSVCWVQTSSPKIAEQIRYWSFATIVAEGWNVSLYIFAVPKKKQRWVLKALGMGPLEKHPRRVQAGIAIGRQHLKRGTVGPGHKNLKAIRGMNLKNEPQS